MGLRYAPARSCPRKLLPGEAKRVPATAPLVGLFIACPACRFVASYLKEEGGLVEEPGNAGPELFAIERPPPCLRCRRRITLVDGVLVAE